MVLSLNLVLKLAVVVFAFSHKLDMCTSLEEELWAIYHGLSVTVRKGFLKIIVESDSLSAIELLDSPMNRYHALWLSYLLLGVLNLIKNRVGVTWESIPREANRCADFFVKNSLDSVVICNIFYTIPSLLHSSLIAHECPGPW